MTDSRTLQAGQATSGSRSVDTTAEEVFSRIAMLSRQAESAGRYFAQALALVAQPFGSPFGAIEVMLPATVVSDYYHSGPTDPGFWKSTVQDLIAQSLSDKQPLLQVFEAKGGGSRLAMLSALIVDEQDEVIGALAVVANCRSQAEAEQHHAVLKALTKLVSTCIRFVGTGNRSKDPETDAVSGRVVSQAATYSSREALAFAVVNNLRNSTGCDQVSLGLVRGKNIQVVAMSGCDDVRDNSPVVGKIRDAMAECLDLGESIVCQKESISKCDVSRSGGRTSTGCRLHRQWHDSINNAPVASIPLKSGDRCIAVVSMKRHFGELFTNEGINKLGTLLQPYAPALDLVDRANRSALRHATESLRRTVYNFLRPSRWASKVVVLSILALGAWLGFGTMEYTVTSPCVIVPAQSRHFCTPHQAKLNKARVVAGDAVKQGDILCEFDTQTLRMEKIRLEAGINIAKINQSIAMAEGSPSEAELAGAEIRKLRADLDIIETKISQAIVRAPFDGVITSGDHRQSIGEILPQGQPLFVLSSQQGWTLRMKVSESQIESIREDLTGCFASKAKPEDLQDFRIVRISPSAEQHDKRNIYIVEAHLNSPPQWVRAGMEGFAKVQTGKRAAWWVLFHNLIDGIRMKLWL